MDIAYIHYSLQPIVNRTFLQLRSLSKATRTLAAFIFRGQYSSGLWPWLQTHALASRGAVLLACPRALSRSSSAASDGSKELSIVVASVCASSTNPKSPLNIHFRSEMTPSQRNSHQTRETATRATETRNRIPRSTVNGGAPSQRAQNQAHHNRRTNLTDLESQMFRPVSGLENIWQYTTWETAGYDTTSQPVHKNDNGWDQHHDQQLHNHDAEPVWQHIASEQRGKASVLPNSTQSSEAILGDIAASNTRTSSPDRPGNSQTPPEIPPETSQMVGAECCRYCSAVEEAKRAIDTGGICQPKLENLTAWTKFIGYHRNLQRNTDPHGRDPPPLREPSEFGPACSHGDYLNEHNLPDGFSVSDANSTNTRDRPPSVHTPPIICTPVVPPQADSEASPTGFHRLPTFDDTGGVSASTDDLMVDADNIDTSTGRVPGSDLVKQVCKLVRLQVRDILSEMGLPCNGHHGHGCGQGDVRVLRRTKSE
ncbi:hypothetical protein BDZ85DRAFT_94652 [Elsinoe ampelina]|uniref:Uncharacterized protein n=1 Tax=Elsinoe ampelina TaxID=302913 RepID=A0A6A6FYH3_9PEZI|nr:hypothetical protein BDZ85DRAFT_94652 [Elsinoe ampelina]